MSALTTSTRSLADVLHALGDLPLERIGMPVGCATEEDVLDALEGSQRRLFELVDGVLVEKTMGFRESFLATEISRHLGNYLEEHDRGLPFGADAPFRLRPGKVRIPDTGFVSWDRLPNHEFPEDPILDAVPNLAVEVYSEGNTPAEMEVKLIDYFQAGVLVVWIVYPKTRSAEVYTSPTKKQVIPPDGVLDGGRLLPGFTLPLKTLFKRLSKRRNGKKGNGRK